MKKDKIYPPFKKEAEKLGLCPSCGSVLLETTETREKNHREFIEYCGGCGDTASSI